jgi:MerR family mercuric resistance operon transcriptional regulator
MDVNNDSLTIGQLAQQAGVGVETLRYYERQKLIPEPPRRSSGYREYPPETVNRIRFIRRAKELGFSLREIDELLTLRAESQGQCAEVLARAQGKIADISQRIASLERMKRALEQLASFCSEHATTGDCPILDALELEP